MLPTAIPGIVTGIMLGMGRIIGETAVFLLTVGGVAQVPTSLSDPVRPMTLHAFIVATQNISLPEGVRDVGSAPDHRTGDHAGQQLRDAEICEKDGRQKTINRS